MRKPRRPTPETILEELYAIRKSLIQELRKEKKVKLQKIIRQEIREIDLKIDIVYDYDERLPSSVTIPVITIKPDVVCPHCGSFSVRKELNMYVCRMCGREFIAIG